MFCWSKIDSALHWNCIPFVVGLRSFLNQQSKYLWNVSKESDLSFSPLFSFRKILEKKESEKEKSKGRENRVLVRGRIISTLKYTQFASEICYFKSEITKFTEIKCIFDSKHLISQTFWQRILYCGKQISNSQFILLIFIEFSNYIAS